MSCAGRYYKQQDTISSKLFKCSKCNFVWTQIYEMGKTKLVEYYRDFPTYQLTRKTCKECLNESNRNKK